MTLPQKVPFFALFLMSSVLSAHADTPVAACQATDGSATVCVYDVRNEANWKSITVTWNAGLKACDDMTVVHYTRQFTQGDVKTVSDAELSAVQKHGIFGLGKATAFKLDRKAGTGSFSGKYRNVGGIVIGDGGPQAPAEPKGSFHFELKCQ